MASPKTRPKTRIAAREATDHYFLYQPTCLPDFPLAKLPKPGLRWTIEYEMSSDQKTKSEHARHPCRLRRPFFYLSNSRNESLIDRSIRTDSLSAAVLYQFGGWRFNSIFDFFWGKLNAWLTGLVGGMNGRNARQGGPLNAYIAIS
jgi:hypothetical protein